MTVEEAVSVPIGASAMRAALARPSSGEGPWPGVVVIHELLGLNDDMRRIAARFAASGYVALAPDLFDGLGRKPVCILRTMAAWRRGGGRALEALEAARSWLAERPEVDASRIGAAGFCMGGGFALLLGTRGAVGVVATFYGDLPHRPEGLRGICPVFAGYGARDRVMGSRAGILERRLRELGIDHEVIVYPDAGHSYMSQYDGLTAWLGSHGPLQAGHVEHAAEESWSKMLRFFEVHLGRR
jgi:carboxymethylenebutenolidase